MKRRELIKSGLIVGLGTLLFPKQTFANPRNFEEYCFQISPSEGIAIRDVDTTPEQFIKENPEIKAVINGPYYNKEGKTEGIAHLAEDWDFGTEKPKDVRGYFSINRKGDEIKVTESLEGNLNDYWMVIGTHPILVKNHQVHNQSKEIRYSKLLAYRSAIGNKGKNICFAVSNDEILMSDWAKRLQNKGYEGAINLDGGPVSQMAIRNNYGVSVKGKGNGNTKLVIFSYKKQ